MPGRHIDVTMDGAALPSGIIIQQVHEDPATMEILNGDRPGRDGQLVLGSRRTTRKVAIECLITEIHNLQTRAQKADALAQWARGTALAVNYRPTQVLRGHCTSYPSLTDVRDYTSPLRVEFTADVVPYWEDTAATTQTINGATGSGTLTVPGTAMTPVCLTVKPTGGTITELSLTVGGKVITFEGLSVSTSQMLYIERDARDSLYIRRGSTGMMSKRTAASADDLMVTPGSVSVSYAADNAVTVTYSVKGRWL